MARKLFCTRAAEGHRKQELGTDRQLHLPGEELVETLCQERGVGPDVLQRSLPAAVVTCFYGTRNGPRIGQWGAEAAMWLSSGLNSAKGPAQSSLEKRVVSFFQGEPAPAGGDGLRTQKARPRHVWQEPGVGTSIAVKTQSCVSPVRDCPEQAMSCVSEVVASLAALG